MGPVPLVLVTLLLADSPKAATLDLRGHAPARVQDVLDRALPALDACITPPRAAAPASHHGRRPPTVVVHSRVAQLVSLAINAPGLVMAVNVEGEGRLDAACVKKAFIRLEFGVTAGPASITAVKVPVVCDPAYCRYPWTPARPDATAPSSTSGTDGTLPPHVPDVPPSASPH
jgi:hypothetical protein